MKPATALNAAIDLLYPGASNRDLVTALRWNVDRTTLASWRSGRRGIPRWALDRVRSELRQRFEPIDRALEHAKERPGLSAGALNLARWRARKQS